MINRLQPWEYEVSGGFTVRGLYTPPTGRPVIHFVHGNGYCGMVYEPVLTHLARYYDLFISDVQGHGESDVGGHYRGWNKNADYCAEVWRAFRSMWGDVKKIGMGHSYGGVTTALMMAQDGSLFDVAVLLDPVFFTRSMAGLLMLSEPFGLQKLSPLSRRARSRRQHWPDRQAAWDYFYERGMFKGWAKESLNAYIDHALRLSTDGLVLKCPPHREADIFASYPKRLWKSIDKITTPTHLFYGERTYDFVIQAARKLGKSHPMIQSEVVSGRHCFMQERPEETAASIHGCLQEALSVIA